MNEQDKPGRPDERTAFAMLLSEEPRLELRLQQFPVRRIVLMIHFGEVGGTSIPIEPDAARRFAGDLVELADQLDAEGTGEQN